MENLKILDCTLRDGGYYTNWDFNKSIVNTYIHAMNILPVDYLELGYRNNPSQEYMGKYGYCPVFELEDLRSKSQKKIAIMLNEKSTSIANLDTLLSPIKGIVDMVRIAIDPKNFLRAVKFAEKIKSMGFEVGFNTMYMSKWKEYQNFLSNLYLINEIADLFCMVDSYGGVTPAEVKEIINIVRKNTICPIGFHGHNNLELGLINTLTAIENGVDYVDATILGMGRGAGNLKMELLLTYLNKKSELNVDFNVLGDIITAFTDLHKQYEWGTNLPYMLSGANSLPQKDVMDWVSNRIYSFNSIVRALDNKKDKIADNAKFPILDNHQFDKIIIIGGGKNATEHLEGIKAYIRNQKSVAVVHATTRNAAYYNDMDIPQFYCLVGSEGKRLAKNIGKDYFKGICILPPYPRIMGTDVPSFAESHTYELPKIEFTEGYQDSCTTIAIQTALFLSKNEISVVGYDGYPGNVLSEKEVALTNENRTLFEDYRIFTGRELISLTPSLYKELKIKSIYQFI